MLKNILSLSICLLLGSFAPDFSAYAISMEGVVTADVLNVRQDPDGKSNIVTSAKKGTKIKIIGSNEDKSWLQVIIGDRKGWVDKKYLQINITGDVNYKTVSTLGNPREQGVLHDVMKIAMNNKYKYVIDNADKTTLNIYDFNNNFISSLPLNYSWVSSKTDLKSIVLAADEEMNFYTNDTSRNVITKYDMKGLKISDLKADVLNDVSYIAYDISDGTLYSLDTSTKTIKGFNKAGLNTKNIFLAETRVAKSFSVNNGKIYVLDYPENEFETYPVYYVNSYSFVLRNNYDPKAVVVETLSKGSILKNNPTGKNFTSKTLMDDDPSKLKIINWVDFSEGDKRYGVAEELKKVNAIGEIDVYKTSGESQFTISLNKKWSLKSPDRHRVINGNDLIRVMEGVAVDPDNNIVVPVLTKIKNSNVASLNYYYFNNTDSSYKISQPLPFENTNSVVFSLSGKDVYSVNSEKYFTILNDNGIEKESLGRISPYKFNLTDKLTLNKNRLFAYDKGNYSIGEYDLNGEPVKVKYINQTTDLFQWSDVFFTDNNILMLKTLDAEEKKLGIEIYNYNLNKTFDKWLVALDPSSTETKVAMNDKKELFILGKGSYYNKKVFLSMFTDKGFLINSWAKELDLINIFSEDEIKLVRENTLKVLGFDQDANIYLLMSNKNNQYIIQKVKINTEGRAEILKIYDTSFFGDLVVVGEGKEKIQKRLFNGTINGDILNIAIGKNGFTYFMQKDIFSKEVRLGLYDTSGTFWKEFSLKDYPGTSGFTLDDQDNIWIAQGTSIKKLATY